MAYEVPRHVHKADGVSKMVQTAADLETAFSEGWVIDPNMLPLVVLTDVVLTDGPASPPDVVEPEPVADEADEGHGEEAEPDSPVEDVTAEASGEPKRRGPGRPRKN